MQTTRSLTQKHGITSRTYTLADDAVIVRENNLLSQSKYKVPYSSLSNDRYEMTTYSKAWLWLAVTFFVLTVAIFTGLVVRGATVALVGMALSVPFALIFSVLLWHSIEKVVGFYADDGPLVFSVGKPTPGELDTFLSELTSRKEAYLRNEYPHDGCCHSAADEIEKLAWLRDKQVLNAVEFEKLKQDVIYGSDWGDSDSTAVN